MCITRHFTYYEKKVNFRSNRISHGIEIFIYINKKYLLHFSLVNFRFVVVDVAVVVVHFTFTFPKQFESENNFFAEAHIFHLLLEFATTKEYIINKVCITLPLSKVVKVQNEFYDENKEDPLELLIHMHIIFISISFSYFKK